MNFLIRIFPLIERTIAAEAAAYERMIAHAPDQWGAIFAPIWPDLEAEAAGEAVPASATGRIDDATSGAAPDPDETSPGAAA